jgi:hypothetical protein
VITQQVERRHRRPGKQEGIPPTHSRRRDTHQFLTAATLNELATRIEADYTAAPVPREADPPGTADYLNTPGPDPDPDGDGELMGLRAAFPHWNISYSPSFRAWTARNDDATVRQGTPALLWVALTLNGRKQRRAGHGPGADGPPGSGG